MNEVRKMIRGIREGGPQFDICIEAHAMFNVASAGRIVKMLEPHFLIMEEGGRDTSDYNSIFIAGWRATFADWKIPEAPVWAWIFRPSSYASGK